MSDDYKSRLAPVGRNTPTMAPTATCLSFPGDIPSHPLLIIDFELIKGRNPQEVDRLWEAATKLGFWYLKNHGADVFVDGMFELGAEAMALPMEEKLKFEQGDNGASFGYKAAGAHVVDAMGQPDTIEFLNVAKDDALAWPKQARRAYPHTVNARMASTIVPFVRQSLEVNNTILDVFNDKLGLPAGSLLKRHLIEEFSECESRITRNGPTTNTTKIAFGSHTDFGSLSFLHNRMGGLQVFAPGSDSWQYVKPIPRHAICNIGDALALFSGGILKSSLHRVLPPPGLQAGAERYSLVYFTRPGNSIILRALVEESPLIAEAVSRDSEKNYETGSTALEWFTRRIKYRRTTNMKGPETWMASRGTERVQVA